MRGITAPAYSIRSSFAPGSGCAVLKRCLKGRVLYLITTWLRVALLHSPASASTALPGFFVRGRLGGMRFRTTQIAGSVACFLELALLPPAADASRGPTGQLIAPSPWFMPILIGFPVLAVA